MFIYSLCYNVYEVQCMRLIELTIKEFDDFATNHPLRNYCQSSAYAKFMGEMGFSYDYVGYEDESKTLVGASLILYKRIGTLAKYAYAPKGFLIDYYNVDLLQGFVKDITKKYKARGVVFMKINPEIIIGELKANKSFAGEYNQNVKIIDDLKTLKFKRRRELEPLEFVMPRISPYLNLKTFNEDDLAPEAKSFINYSKRKGLEIEVASPKEINYFYEFIKNTTSQNINYFRNMFNVFSKSDMAELLLVKVDYREFLVQARESYDLELENNNNCNLKIQEDASEENLNLKMASDKLLLQLKNNIVEATDGLKKNPSQYVAGALIVKYLNRISIIASGLDEKFATLYPLHFLHNQIIERFKSEYDYLDLNGLAADFSPNSRYFDANQFKLGFNPAIYEFIGEFDYIIDEGGFARLQSSDAITKEFKNQRLN